MLPFFRDVMAYFFIWAQICPISALTNLMGQKLLVNQSFAYKNSLTTYSIPDIEPAQLRESGFNWRRTLELFCAVTD